MMQSALWLHTATDSLWWTTREREKKTNTHNQTLNTGELWYMMRKVAFADDQMFKFHKLCFMDGAVIFFFTTICKIGARARINTIQFPKIHRNKAENYTQIHNGRTQCLRTVNAWKWTGIFNIKRLNRRCLQSWNINTQTNQTNSIKIKMKKKRENSFRVSSRLGNCVFGCGDRISFFFILRFWFYDDFSIGIAPSESENNAWKWFIIVVSGMLKTKKREITS